MENEMESREYISFANERDHADADAASQYLIAETSTPIKQSLCFIQVVPGMVA